MHRHKRASLAWKLPVKCQIQPLARIELPPLTFFSPLFTFYVFYFSFLSFPSSVSLPSAVFSVSTLLMLVESLRANAVNVSGFKALQMSACFIYLSISLFFFFFFPKKALKTEPGTNLSGLWTGSIMDATTSPPAPKRKTTVHWLDASKWASSSCPT